MRRSIQIAFGLLLIAVLVYAQAARVSGRVHMLNKDTSEITVATRDHVQRVVVYNPDTKFEYGHSNNSKAAKLDQLQQGNYIVCAGKFEGVKLVAQRCIFREVK